MTGMVVSADEVNLEYSLDAGTTWAEVPDAKNVFIPKTSTDWRDRTTVNVKDRHKRYGRGMKDTAEGAINCFATKEAMDAGAQMEAVTDPDGCSFRVTFKPTPDQSTGDAFTYKAHVELDYGDGETDVDGDMMCSLQLRPSGPVTRTPGEAAV